MSKIKKFFKDLFQGDVFREDFDTPEYRQFVIDRSFRDGVRKGKIWTAECFKEKMESLYGKPSDEWCREMWQFVNEFVKENDGNELV